MPDAIFDIALEKRFTDSALIAEVDVSSNDTLLIRDVETGALMRLPFSVLTAAISSAFASSFASLDGSGKVPTSQLPDAILGALNYKGIWNASTNSPSIPAASSANKGHYYVVSVAGTTNIDGESDWQIGDWIVSSGANWGKIDNSDKVSSVAGKTGAVTLTKADVGLSNVDNTSDANKPVSTVQQTALDAKANKAGETFTGDIEVQKSSAVAVSVNLKKVDGTIVGKIRANQTGELVVSGTNGVYLRPAGDGSGTNQMYIPPSGHLNMPGTYVAGAPTPTGYITVVVGGTGYKIPVST